MDMADFFSDMGSDSDSSSDIPAYTPTSFSNKHSSPQYQATVAEFEMSDDMGKPVPGLATRKRKGLINDIVSACENGTNTVSQSMYSQDNDGASKKTKWPTVKTVSHHSPHLREMHDSKSATSTPSTDTNAQLQPKWKWLDGRGVVLTNVPGEVLATANNGSPNTSDERSDPTVDDKSKINIALDPNITKPDNVFSPIPNTEGGRECDQKNDKRDPTTLDTRAVHDQSSSITDVVNMLIAGNDPAQTLIGFIAKCALEPVPFDEFRRRREGEDEHKDELERSNRPSNRPICVGGWNGCGERLNCACLDPKATTKHNVNPGKPKTGRSKQPSKFSKCFDMMDDSKLQESDMIDSFLARTNDELTWKEASLFLRLCGANVKVAHTMYYNMGGLVRARRVLAAWSSLPANEEVVEDSKLPDYPSFENYLADTSSSCDGLDTMSMNTASTVEAECEATAPADANLEVCEAMKTLRIPGHLTLNWNLLCKYFGDAMVRTRGTPHHAQKVASSFSTMSRHMCGANWWKMCSCPDDKTVDELVQQKSEQMMWSRLAYGLSMTMDDCKERFTMSGPNLPKTDHAVAGDARNSGPKSDVGGAQEKSPYRRDHAAGHYGVHEDYTAPPRFTNVFADIAAAGSTAALNGLLESAARDFPGPARRASSNPINDNHYSAAKSTKPNAPVSSTYTVTYTAKIECGDKTVHIPIDSDNVTGTEKTIIEGEGGMNKVWKWVQEKSLGDKISLQDAFDLARDMHGGDEAQVSEDKSDGVTVQAKSKSGSDSGGYWPVRVLRWDSPSVTGFSQLPQPHEFSRSRAGTACGSPEP